MKLSTTLCNRNRIHTRSLLHRISATIVDSTLSKIESEGRPDFLKEKDSKYFEFQRLESSIYKWWEQSGFFEPVPYENGEEDPFVLPMPPPNVTGYLHMGHAIFIALQDIMARFHRMRGRPTLWLPGT
jgi:valyl-tRNA synthetase